MLEIDKLKQFTPFNEMGDDHLEDVFELITFHRFSKGEILFKRGKEMDEKVYLLSGDLDLIDSSFVAEKVSAASERALTALNSESPTSCSAVAKSDVDAFSISLTSLETRPETAVQTAESIMDDIEYHYNTGEMQVAEVLEEEATDWMSVLLQSPLFSRIPTANVRDLFVKFEDTPYKAGTAVIKEGEVGDYFYVISAGKARVTNNIDTVNLGLKPGDYFGEEALLGQTTRNASVIMETDGVLKRLSMDNFTALLKEPVIGYVDQDGLSEIKRPYQILDVKMPIEYRLAHVSGSINLPLTKLRTKMDDMDQNNLYLVTDDAGSRADIAAHLLCQAGFDALILKGSAA